jgi:hypothetical protein
MSFLVPIEKPFFFKMNPLSELLLIEFLEEFKHPQAIPKNSDEVPIEINSGSKGVELSNNSLV